MRTLIAFLVLALALPVFAQDQKAEKKTEKKAAKKANKKAPVKKTEKTTAEPKQDWGRFQSQSKKDEAQRAADAAKKQ